MGWAGAVGVRFNEGWVEVATLCCCVQLLPCATLWDSGAPNVRPLPNAGHHRPWPGGQAAHSLGARACHVQALSGHAAPDEVEVREAAALTAPFPPVSGLVSPLCRCASAPKQHFEPQAARKDGKAIMRRDSQLPWNSRV